MACVWSLFYDMASNLTLGDIFYKKNGTAVDRRKDWQVAQDPHGRGLQHPDGRDRGQARGAREAERVLAGVPQSDQ